MAANWVKISSYQPSPLGSLTVFLRLDSCPSSFLSGFVLIGRLNVRRSILIGGEFLRAKFKLFVSYAREQSRNIGVVTMKKLPSAQGWASNIGRSLLDLDFFRDRVVLGYSTGRVLLDFT